MFHTGVGLVLYQQVVGQGTVLSVVAVLPLLLRLVGCVGLAAVRVSLSGFFRVLRYEVAPVVVGVEVVAQDPAAVVAAGGQLLHLIPGIVFLVGADAVGQVHCGGTVQGIVLVGGDAALRVGGLYQVVEDVVLVPGHPAQAVALLQDVAARAVGEVRAVAQGRGHGGEPVNLVRDKRLRTIAVRAGHQAVHNIGLFRCISFLHYTCSSFFPQPNDLDFLFSSSDLRSRIDIPSNGIPTRPKSFAEIFFSPSLMTCTTNYPSTSYSGYHPKSCKYHRHISLAVNPLPMNPCHKTFFLSPSMKQQLL